MQKIIRELERALESSYAHQTVGAYAWRKYLRDALAEGRKGNLIQAVFWLGFARAKWPWPEATRRSMGRVVELIKTKLEDE